MRGRFGLFRWALFTLKRNERIFCLRSFISPLFRRMLVPFWPLYIGFLGADMVQYGGLISLSDACGTISQLPAGYVADYYGRKKIILTTSLVGIAVILSYLLAMDWVWLLPGMAVSGLLSVAGPAWSALQADSVPAERRSTTFSLFNTLSAISLGIGPLFGGFIVSLAGGVAIDSIRVILLLQFFGAFGLWFTYVRFEETLGVGKGRETEAKASFKRTVLSFLNSFYDILQGKEALTAWLLVRAITSFITQLFTAYFLFYIYLVIKLSGPFVLALVFTAPSMTQVIFALPLGRVADKIGRKPVITFSMVFDVCLIVWFIFIKDILSLILLMALSGVISAAMVSWNTLEVELVPSSQRGRWNAILGLVNRLAMVPAPILGGYLWAQISPSAVFSCYIVFWIMAFLIFLRYVPETLNRLSHKKSITFPRTRLECYKITYQSNTTKERP